MLQRRSSCEEGPDHRLSRLEPPETADAPMGRTHDFGLSTMLTVITATSPSMALKPTPWTLHDKNPRSAIAIRSRTGRHDHG
jgi:hypothetical protein